MPRESDEDLLSATMKRIRSEREKECKLKYGSYEGRSNLQLHSHSRRYNPATPQCRIVCSSAGCTVEIEMSQFAIWHILCIWEVGRILMLQKKPPRK